ncbi:YHS domain-containing (seleno)protein [Undibacterium umbellatum]|jgi:YHS domain-containing protein|nr:YHS domain-containing (seleno)protein [Undibacterium umbellatum]
MQKFSLNRRLALAVMAASMTMIGSLPQIAMAYDENSSSAVNVDAKGVGLKGFDPVAYFTASAPTMGKSSITAAHDGVTYHFASTENRDKFKTDPAKYAPQYGGFCAMGVALEKKLDGDPQAWRVVDGKLYLNVNKDVQKKWLEDVPGNLKKAEMNWGSIKTKTPKSL